MHSATEPQNYLSLQSPPPSLLPVGTTSSTEPRVISLPNNWVPRWYQREALAAWERGVLRQFWAWHRRAGKDDCAMHMTACSMMKRVGTYWHMLPEASQARKAIWDAVNPHTGKRRIDEAFPDELFPVKRSQDMFIRALNGSTWQVLGSDNFNSLVGSPPIGLVFSEYALARPEAWSYLRPILAENGGWVVFVTTLRGKNHAYNQLRLARGLPDWFVSEIDAVKSGVFTPEALEKERLELIAELGEADGEAVYLQEYMNNVNGAVSGAYFGSHMASMVSEGRVTAVGYDPALPVDVGFDLGVDDAMALVFAQRSFGQIRVIDYYEASGQSLQTVAKLLKEKPYTYGTFFMPHDIRVREIGNGAKSRYDTALSLGIKPIHVVQRIKSVADIAHHVRAALPKMVIDEKRCAVLVEHMGDYRKKWNAEMKVWEDRPAKGAMRHGIDALVTYIRGYEPTLQLKTVEQVMGSICIRGAW